MQELRTGADLQQLQQDVNAVLGEGRSLIHTSPVGVDTSDIELTVSSVGKLLADINQRVMHTYTSLSLLAVYTLQTSMTNIYVKNCSVYIQCKGDIVVVDIKQHRSQFKKFKLYHYTVSKVLLTLCNGDV